MKAIASFVSVVIVSLVFATQPGMASQPVESLQIEVGCKRQLICDEGEVCRARIHYYPFLMKYLNRHFSPVAKEKLVIEKETGVVSVVVSPEEVRELLAVDLSFISCRENDTFFKTYSIPLSELRGWRVTRVEQASTCRSAWNGTGEVKVREVKFGLIHESRSLPAFKTDIVEIPCDLPSL